MKDHLVAIAAAAVFAVPWAAQAQTAKPGQSSIAPDVKTFDQRLSEAQAQVQRMQEQMDRLRHTQDPQERQKLMQDHYQSMQNAMVAMHGMWGPAMTGGPGTMDGPGMMRWGDMRGYYSKLTPEQLKQRQYMMDRYIAMQQMMMDHMIQRQQWMTPPPTPSGK